MGLGERGVALQPLLDRALALASSEKNRAVVLHETGIFHFEHGRYRDAERAFREALALNSDPGSYGHAATLHALAIVVDSSGRLSEAEELLRRSLEIFARFEGEEGHPASLHVLAGVLEQEGRYLKAEDLLRRSLAIKEERLGSRHPSYSSSLRALSEVLVEQGRYDEAEEVLGPLLDAEDLASAPGDPHRVAALQSLATLREPRSLSTRDSSPKPKRSSGSLCRSP
jgi:tetratricopeptide (TPR) repeat protein